MLTKDFVLYQLKTKNGFVSGEEISRSLGVSRAAVNAAVKSLRDGGYRIESVTNKGYRFFGGDETLSLGEMLPWLEEKEAERITVLSRVDSTNTYLKNAAACGKATPGAFVITNEQTAGKGRLGRRFESAAGAGIYCSYLLETKNLSPADLPEITAWGAVAVRSAIEEVCGVSCGIKWVNDLVFGRQKVCGILTELSVEGESGRIQSAVIGIGINVRQKPEDFPPALRAMATSLESAAGRPVSRAHLCAVLLKNLDRLCADFPAQREQYLADYRRHTVILGQTVTLLSGNDRKTGKAVGIDPHFGLIWENADGTTETVSGGEISVQGFYGK
ncbi:MAG: biotin--[Clostridia bacterium]|nr:biotin--[acetyl-CoA-carboxylase] ligase [Clostridia bacterium]